jgi:hypothetical protein
MKRVVSLNQYRMEKQYTEFGSTCLDLSLDTAFPVHKEKKRDIAKELTLGYMKLLSNFRG